MLVNLIATKVNIPPQPAQLVPRTRLLNKLDQGLRPGNKVMLVSAPAGYGKTTLVVNWVRERGLPTAWISLDDSDNDLVRFLNYLAAAFRRVSPDLADDLFDEAKFIKNRASADVLTPLVNIIERSGEPLVLVLDDYHLISTQVVHDSVGFLVEHLPPQAHVIILTRADPPLPLALLRGRGQLTELRLLDLRFTSDEVSSFIQLAASLELAPQQLTELVSLTEGWAAGLQMAAASMQDHPDLDEFIRSFSGSHRYILDYLLEEVLERQPSQIQEFLLKTSILDRLNGSLCDYVLATSGRTPQTQLANGAQINLSVWRSSQEILEYLDRANLFILPLDEQRQWYRYHRLFADLLHKRLVQKQADLIPDLHRCASIWHEHQGITDAAIDHALASKDFERAATLIEDSVEATLMRSEIRTFRNWVERLPEETMHSHPTLCFYHAWALLMSGRSPEVIEQHLQDLDCVSDAAGGTSIMTGRMAALRAYIMIFQADIRQAIELCHQALEQLPGSDLYLRSIVTWILSMARLDGGDLQNGNQAIQEVVRMGQEIGNPMIAVGALCDQARLEKRQGRLFRAKAILERALNSVTDLRGGRLPIASEALIGLGELEREWNHLEEAANYLSEGIELARQWSEMAPLDAYFSLMRVNLARGDVKGARQALDNAWQIAKNSDLTGIDDFITDLQQAYFFVFEGNIEGVTRWAEKRGLLPEVSPKPYPGLEAAQDYIDAHMRKYEHLVLARLYILQDRAAEALELLKNLLAQARQLRRTDLIIESQILMALAWHAKGQDSQAVDALAEALTLAEPGGYLRIFLDEGEPMVELLRRAGSRHIAPAYVRKLLAACGEAGSIAPSSASAQHLAEPLSERELEVLQLMATGMSNPEIAEQLVVAVSTVQSHCKSIYSKLNVHKRWDAVQRAQELGII